MTRGWGRPNVEEVPAIRGIEHLSDDDCNAMVREALLARAVSGDVTAQQVWLKIPTRVELTQALTPERLGLLNDNEMETFQKIMCKLGMVDGVA
jgi:hypothetical protein